MTAPAAIATTALPLPRVAQGKVRDIYEVDDRHLLLVTTDRISAFDVVMREPIPGKGIVLTQVTAWWLRTLGDLVPNHLVSADTDEIVRRVPALADHRAAIAGRAMLVRRARIFPVECVIRGYLSGSMWKEYAAHGTMAGEPVAAGLRESDRFPTPLFTPATKAETGHDENITIARMRGIVGDATAAELERLTRLVYETGSAYARERGISIADTKFEFGECDVRIILCDDVLTPDSSRFWPGDGYTPGGPQPSFDKQPLRDWLEVERRAGRWNGEAPPPTLPSEVVAATSARYLDAYRRLTGTPLDLGALA